MRERKLRSRETRAQAPPGSKPGGASRRADFRPVLRFVAIFAALLIAFQFLYYTVIVKSGPFEAYVAGNSRAAAFLLRLCGDDEARATGATIDGAFGLDIKQGCDGLQAIAVLAIAVIAFPSRLAHKVWGVLLGVAGLLAINILRIVTLYWTGIVWREQFQPIHLHLWPALMVFAAFALWVVWAIRVTAPACEARA